MATPGRAGGGRACGLNKGKGKNMALEGKGKGKTRNPLEKSGFLLKVSFYGDNSSFRIGFIRRFP
ncbi:MAG: hypothetical protein MJY62_05625 [Bacteroidales bacterium]|nr:hypothetical protein [Bacteroidales bacterium]